MIGPVMSMPRSMRFSVVLVLCASPSFAQSTGTLKETWDGGKTWHREGTGRPTHPAPPTPPSPAEIARQQAAAAEAQRRSEASAANDRALEAQKRGNLEEAQRLFGEALAKWDTPAFRQNFANNTNKLAIAAQERGELEIAAQQFEQALVNWDHPVIRENLVRVRAQIQQRRREEQEFRDAPVVGRMRAQLQDLGRELGTAAPMDFDGGAATQSTALPSGLDFIGLPSKAAPSGKGGTPDAPVDFSDTSVVDLSNAKTLVVDPAKVAGRLEAAQTEGVRDALNSNAGGAGGNSQPATDTPVNDPVFAAAVRDATRADLAKARSTAADAWRAYEDATMTTLFLDNDKNAERDVDRAWTRFREADQTARELRAQQHTLHHDQLVADMRRIRQDPALAAELDKAEARIRASERAGLEFLSDPEHAKLALQLELKSLQNAGVFRDSTDLLARAQTDPRIRAALDRARASVMHDQADEMRDATDELTRVVQELKRRLPTDSTTTNTPNGPTR